MSIHTKDKLVQLLIEMAASYVGFKEVSPNRSNLIDKINDFIGVIRGSPYCLSGILFCINELKKEHGFVLDIPKTGHCMTFFNQCKNLNPDNVYSQAEVGDIAIWNFVGTSLGHAGLVESVLDPKTIQTIEFNTKNETAINRDGDGIYRRKRSQIGSKTMKLKGFIRIKDFLK